MNAYNRPQMSMPIMVIIRTMLIYLGPILALSLASCFSAATPERQGDNKWFVVRGLIETAFVLRASGDPIYGMEAILFFDQPGSVHESPHWKRSNYVVEQGHWKLRYEHISMWGNDYRKLGKHALDHVYVIGCKGGIFVGCVRIQLDEHGYYWQPTTFLEESCGLSANIARGTCEIVSELPSALMDIDIYKEFSIPRSLLECGVSINSNGNTSSTVSRVTPPMVNVEVEQVQIKRHCAKL